jgi:hypothetical protein
MYFKIEFLNYTTSLYHLTPPQSPRHVLGRCPRHVMMLYIHFSILRYTRHGHARETRALSVRLYSLSAASVEAVLQIARRDKLLVAL